MGRWFQKGMRPTHAESRIDERYGEKIGWAGLLEVKNLIGTKHSMLVDRRAHCETWDVFYRDQIMRLVYDPHTKVIVTFLPSKRELASPARAPFSVRLSLAAVTLFPSLAWRRR